MPVESSMLKLETLYYIQPFLCVLCIKKCPYVMRAATNMKLTVLERLDICSYHIKHVPLCIIFYKYFLENMGFLYTPSIQWPMEAYSNGSKRYVYDRELKLH